jgi:hypothetical protein
MTGKLHYKGTKVGERFLGGQLYRSYFDGEKDIDRMFDKNLLLEKEDIQAALSEAYSGSSFKPLSKKLSLDEDLTGFFIPFTAAKRRDHSIYPLSTTKGFILAAKALGTGLRRPHPHLSNQFPAIDNSVFEKLFDDKIVIELSSFTDERSRIQSYYWLCHFAVSVLYLPTLQGIIKSKKERATSISTAINTLFDNNVFGENKWVSYVFWKNLQHRFKCASKIYGVNSKYLPFVQVFDELCRITQNEDKSHEILADVMTSIIKRLERRRDLFPDLFGNDKSEAGSDSLIYGRLLDQLRLTKFDDTPSGLDFITIF